MRSVSSLCWKASASDRSCRVFYDHFEVVSLVHCFAEPANPLLDKYQELLKAVTEKPDDFSTWTTLVSTAEKLVR
jgi:hypothetical protein